jgi:hypothetical protein
MTTTRLTLPSSASSFWQNKKLAVIPHSPNSLDLAPCDFFLFPKVKLKLKGRRFDTIEQIQTESQRVLPGIVPKIKETVETVSTCGTELLRG